MSAIYERTTYLCTHHHYGRSRLCRLYTFVFWVLWLVLQCHSLCCRSYWDNLQQKTDLESNHDPLNLIPMTYLKISHLNEYLRTNGLFIYNTLI